MLTFSSCRQIPEKISGNFWENLTKNVENNTHAVMGLRAQIASESFKKYIEKRENVNFYNFSLFM